MKFIDIVIATRNRYMKLARTIESIPDLDFIGVQVVVDGEMDTVERIQRDWRFWKKHNFTLIHHPEHKGATICRNLVIPKRQDGVLYATDDIAFGPNACERALESFNEHFPDDDGVLGLAQTGNRKYHPTGVALIGKKFLDRYPGRKPFYPEYFHFAAQEIHWLAEKLGKFYHEPRASIRHYNPFMDKKHMDQTHEDARIHKVRDKMLRESREFKGLIWGDK